MKKVIILKGLPASGKSTWAKEMLDKHPGMYKRINKDDLRAMLDNLKWSGDNEKFVVALRDYIIIESLKAGKHVIVDDTNFHEKHETRIKQIVEENKLNATVKVRFFPIELKDAIEYDLKRPNSVGAKVITDMYNQYLRTDKEVEKYVAPKDVPLAIICDIDGTLAKMSGRGPYEIGKVDTDVVNPPIADMIRLYEETGHVIIILSGRDGSSEGVTRKWLIDNDIPFDALYMRPTGNTENDAIIKKRLFDENIRDDYDVRFVLDDRNRVVDMWREIGLTCLQVDYGDF